MELFYAKRKGKKVVIVSEIKCLSPWIVAHADMIVKRLGELEEALKHLRQKLENIYQLKPSKATIEVIFLNEKHRVIKKNFETNMWIDGIKLPLNYMMQETIANIMFGFSKTLKGPDGKLEKIELKIRRLPKPEEVDAHTYP